MQKITPFLWFDKQAEEAANYYVSIFPNSRVLRTTRYGEHGPMPKGTAMTVQFDLNGQQFTALNGGPLYQFDEAISFVIACDSQQEIDHYWDSLTADGGAPIECGWLKDKYGLRWQVVPSNLDALIGKDPEQSNRVMGALLQMKKLDIAKLEEAAKG
ncbi:MAG: VOC family protein [Thermoanaerobaculia bacterium]